jgi:hypothetical protein
MPRHQSPLDIVSRDTIRSRKPELYRDPVK